MKRFLFLMFFPMLALADIQLNNVQCGTGQTATCLSPAPGYSKLTFNPSYGRLTLTTTAGKVYDSGLHGANNEGGVVYAADGTHLTVATVFAIYLKQVQIGRGQGYVTHWELEDGSIT